MVDGQRSGVVRRGSATPAPTVIFAAARRGAAGLPRCRRHRVAWARAAANPPGSDSARAGRNRYGTAGGPGVWSPGQWRLPRYRRDTERAPLEGDEKEPRGRAAIAPRAAAHRGGLADR